MIYSMNVPIVCIAEVAAQQREAEGVAAELLAGFR